MEKSKIKMGHLSFHIKEIRNLKWINFFELVTFKEYEAGCHPEFMNFSHSL